MSERDIKRAIRVLFRRAVLAPPPPFLSSEAREAYLAELLALL